MAKKKLTEKQALFLEYLFGEAKGNPVEAKKLAGYTPDYATSLLIKSVEDELIEYTKRFLVQNGPKAVLAITDAIDDPTQLGMKFKIDAAKDVLDRIGVVKTEKIEINSGLFILPPKNEDE